MQAWKGFALRNRGPGEYAGGLDVGDGRTLPPEDVLDGYSARLLARRQGAVRTVPVQVGDDLSAAITVMAPDLAPLADIAQRVAEAVPAVAPEPDFRRNLSEALERTHRQHLCEEALGTRRARRGDKQRVAAALVAAALLVLLFGGVGWMAARRIRGAQGQGVAA